MADSRRIPTANECVMIVGGFATIFYAIKIFLTFTLAAIAPGLIFLFLGIGFILNGIDEDGGADEKFIGLAIIVLIAYGIFKP